MVLILQKVKTLVSLDSRKRKMLNEAFFYLAWARILKIIPFKKLAPSLGIQMEETTLENIRENRETLQNVSDVIHIMSIYTFWESQCLVKAIAGMKMLQKRRIESTLYFGTAKDEEGKMIAHAWLRSGAFYVTGVEGMEKFTVVTKFANRIRDKEIRGNNDENQ
ncbi:MAG: hypothetical protein K0S25_1454 [Bacillus sp. (in: firmicutes)]|jgi:hypothetical protein|nr:hypothetical protein [Bacillus sp. (in: firmicutes)]